MSKNVKTILAAILIVLVIGFLYWISIQEQGPATGEPIKIGWIGPLTGDVAAVGQNARAATEIAVAEVNAVGGVDGRPLEIIYEDGMCDGQEASSAANKLINIDQVQAIIGGQCSGETSAFVTTAMENQVVTITPCSSAPALSGSGEYFFRLYPSDNFQGSYGAQYAYDELGKTKTAILFSQNDWGMGIKEVFEKEYKELGGKIVSIQEISPADKDFKVQLRKIKDSGAELIYFLAYTEQTIQGVKQAAELGLDLPFLGADAWDDGTIWEALGETGEGVRFLVPYSPKSDEFKAAMLAKVGDDTIIACSPAAYDIVKILTKAMNKLGTDAPAIKDYIHDMKPYVGVANDNIVFDTQGELATVSYSVKEIKDGKAQEIKIIK